MCKTEKRRMKMMTLTMATIQMSMMKLQYSPKVLGHFVYFYSGRSIHPLLPLNNVGY